MFYSTAILAATAALSSFATAQNYSTGPSGMLEIDVSQVDYTLRQAWCRGQTNSCPEICGGVASQNTCDPNTLDYTCDCANGNTPNISSFEITIPAYICRTWIANCVANNPDDLDAQTACQSVSCGTRNATALSVDDSSSSTSSSMSMSMSATASSSGGMTSSTSDSDSSDSSSSDSDSSTSTSDADSADSSDSAAIMNLAMNYGTGALAVGILGVFGFAL